jgi:hypothetical protein
VLGAHGVPAQKLVVEDNGLKPGQKRLQSNMAEHAVVKRLCPNHATPIEHARKIVVGEDGVRGAVVLSLVVEDDGTDTGLKRLQKRMEEHAVVPQELVDHATTIGAQDATAGQNILLRENVVAEVILADMAKETVIVIVNVKVILFVEEIIVIRIFGAALIVVHQSRQHAKTILVHVGGTKCWEDAVVANTKGNAGRRAEDVSLKSANFQHMTIGGDVLAQDAQVNVKCLLYFSKKI